MNIMNKQLLFVFLYVTLLVQSCSKPQPQLQPQPQPQPQPTAELYMNYESNYMPFVVTPECAKKDSRLGLAYSLDYKQYLKVLKMLCMNTDAPVRTWSFKNLKLDDYGHFVPTIWDTQYVQPFKEHYDNQYVGTVFAYNEPGEVSQAQDNYYEIASNLIDIYIWCNSNPIRECDIVAPGFSSGDRDARGRIIFNGVVSDLGGDYAWFSCDEHLYIFPEHIPNFDIARVNDKAYVKQQLEQELEFRLTALRNAGCKRITVSEIGVCWHWPFADYWLQYQLDYLLKQTDVSGVYVFVDDTYYSYQPCAYYLATGDGLTGIGYGILQSGNLNDYYTPNSYP